MHAQAQQRQLDLEGVQLSRGGCRANVSRPTGAADDELALDNGSGTTGAGGWSTACFAHTFTVSLSHLVGGVVDRSARRSACPPMAAAPRSTPLPIKGAWYSCTVAESHEGGLTCSMSWCDSDCSDTCTYTCTWRSSATGPRLPHSWMAVDESKLCPKNVARRRRASRSSAIACEQGGRGGASVEARGEVCGDEVADGAKKPGELSRGMECTLAERPQVRRYPARPSQPASIRPSPPSKPQGESLVTHQLTAGSGEGCTGPVACPRDTGFEAWPDAPSNAASPPCAREDVVTFAFQ